MKMEHAVGKTIKGLREDFNWQAAEFAREVPINRSYLSEIEHGKKAPSFSMLVDIANAFEMNPSELLRSIAETLDEQL